MSFVFISHAQPDKLRPDRRLRALAHFLNDAGVPLWVDRPEELGLDSHALEQRCIELNGVWTSNIRDALNRCAAGLGVWSMHARRRLRDDAAGVLFQELNALSVSGRLHLVAVDPGIAAEAGKALRQLAADQQVTDLGMLERETLTRRVGRLVTGLAGATKAKSGRVKLYVEALNDRASAGALDVLQPDRKRAREAAAALLAAFETHDPGRLPAELTPELAAAYNRILNFCRRGNIRFRTFHRVVALMQLPSGFVQACFDEVTPGLGERIETWLVRQAEKRGEAYVDVDIFSDPLSQAAAAIAEAENAPAIDERHVLLAMLEQGDSGTIRAIKESIGADKLAAVARVARQRRPRQGQGFDQTGPLSGIFKDPQ